MNIEQIRNRLPENCGYRLACVAETLGTTTCNVTTQQLGLDLTTPRCQAVTESVENWPPYIVPGSGTCYGLISLEQQATSVQPIIQE